jgi:hypothetical protein
MAMSVFGSGTPTKLTLRSRRRSDKLVRDASCGISQITNALLHIERIGKVRLPHANKSSGQPIYRRYCVPYTFFKENYSICLYFITIAYINSRKALW